MIARDHHNSFPNLPFTPLCLNNICSPGLRNLCPCVCVSVFVCAYVFVCVHACAHVHLWWPELIPSNHSHTLPEKCGTTCTLTLTLQARHFRHSGQPAVVQPTVPPISGGCDTVNGGSIECCVFFVGLFCSVCMCVFCGSLHSVCVCVCALWVSPVLCVCALWVSSILCV